MYQMKGDGRLSASFDVVGLRQSNNVLSSGNCHSESGTIIRGRSTTQSLPTSRAAAARGKQMRVFLSYCHEDSACARKVAGVLKERGTDVWCDEWDLSIGSRLFCHIQEETPKADLVVLFLSDSMLASRGLAEEIEAGAICLMQSSDAVKILPAIHGECGITPLLTDSTAADFRRSFILGVTGILRVAIGAEGLRPLDKAFERHARQIDADREARARSALIRIADVRRRIQAYWKDRWMTACSSAGSLTIAVFKTGSPYATSDEIEDPNPGLFQNKLGKLTRDFLHFKLFDHVFELLDESERTGGIGDMDSTGLQAFILEHLYPRIDDDIRDYGLHGFRLAEPYMVEDLDSVFSCFNAEKQ